MKINKALLMMVMVISAVSAYWYLARDAHLDASHSEERHATEEETFAKGEHNGRLLTQDNFAIEITIMEEGMPPQFRAFAYVDNKPIDPEKVGLTIELTRLDKEVNNFTFTPQEGVLIGNGTVLEPHSFDVKVKADYNGKSYAWAFASYEGRTTISDAAAERSGIKVEAVGAAKVRDTVALTGRITLNPDSTAHVSARFAGIIRSVEKSLGEKVEAGEVLATIESNESLQRFAVNSPISGIILARHANIGELAGDAPLFTVSDISTVFAEFPVFSRDMERVHVGQNVLIRAVEGSKEGSGIITSLLPMIDGSNQTLIARVKLDNTNSAWYSGMAVRSEVIISERDVPRAVKASALQHFRDFTVVFARIGTTYEVRMLELGANDGEWVEVLSGINAGTDYVTENSFLIRADIEKSGAQHDH